MQALEGGPERFRYSENVALTGASEKLSSLPEAHAKNFGERKNQPPETPQLSSTISNRYSCFR
jgi:hypothetical protein